MSELVSRSALFSLLPPHVRRGAARLDIIICCSLSYLSILPPAVQLLKRAFAEPSIIKGIICHGLWIVAAAPELVRGRRITTHNNLYGDAVNMGAVYVDQDVVDDGDLVTGRTGGHCHLFARTIIDKLAAI